MFNWYRQCPSFHLPWQVAFNEFCAKNHNASKPIVTHDCYQCGQNVHSFYSLRHHKTQQDDLGENLEREMILQALK